MSLLILFPFLVANTHAYIGATTGGMWGTCPTQLFDMWGTTPKFFVSVLSFGGYVLLIEI